MRQQGGSPPEAQGQSFRGGPAIQALRFASLFSTILCQSSVVDHAGINSKLLRFWGPLLLRISSCIIAAQHPPRSFAIHLALQIDVGMAGRSASSRCSAVKRRAGSEEALRAAGIDSAGRCLLRMASQAMATRCLRGGGGHKAQQKAQN